MGGLLSGGLEHFLCSIIYGMSSFPLTHIFQNGYCTTNHLKISGESRSIHWLIVFVPIFWPKNWWPQTHNPQLHTHLDLFIWPTWAIRHTLVDLFLFLEVYCLVFGDCALIQSSDTVFTVTQLVFHEDRVIVSYSLRITGSTTCGRGLGATLVNQLGFPHWYRTWSLFASQNDVISPRCLEWS